MPHEDRPLIQPTPRHSFREVHTWLIGLPNSEIDLILPSGVAFKAVANQTGDGRDFIVCTGNNRIYECCWGNYNNHMGQEGQRIGHYSSVLDTNCP